MNSSSWTKVSSTSNRPLDLNALTHFTYIFWLELSRDIKLVSSERDLSAELDTSIVLHLQKKSQITKTTPSIWVLKINSKSLNIIQRRSIDDLTLEDFKLCLQQNGRAKQKFHQKLKKIDRSNVAWKSQTIDSSAESCFDSIVRCYGKL